MFDRQSSESVSGKIIGSAGYISFLHRFLMLIVGNYLYHRGGEG